MEYEKCFFFLARSLVLCLLFACIKQICISYDFEQRRDKTFIIQYVIFRGIRIYWMNEEKKKRTHTQIGRESSILIFFFFYISSASNQMGILWNFQK